MLKNYLKTTLRNLRKHFGYTSINLVGLALGLTVTLQIFLFVQSELGYDSFHENAGDIYRVTLDGSFAGTDINAPVTPTPMAAALADEFPEVQYATRLYPFANEQMVRNPGIEPFLDDQVYFVDSTFFDVLTFPFLQGDPSQALNRPSTVVLAESIAARVFGDVDPLGESIILGDTTAYEVTGIVADPPKNSHIQFHVLLTMTGWPPAQSQFWINNSFFAYLRLFPGSSAEQVEARLPEFFKEKAGPQFVQALGQSYDEVMTGDNVLNYQLESIRDVHLRTNYEIDLQPSGDITYVYLFIAVALFILLLACINFMNLSTARSANRAMEVGIRKVSGSSRGQLVTQFLSESVTMTIMAMILAVGLVILTTPFFNTVTDQTLQANVLLEPIILLSLLGGAIFVGILAGSYPAIFLSGFKPVDVMKSQSSTGKGKSLLRNSLVVFQFAISTALLVGTFVVGDQLEFIQKRQLGFDKEHTIVIERAGQLRTQSEAFKDQIRGLAGVTAVSGASSLPGGLHGGTPFQPEGSAADEMHLMAPIVVDYDFIEAMGIELADGRSFSRDFPSDSAAFIINEAALRELGWDEAIGKRLQSPGQPNAGPVIGVIKDYHYADLRREIGSVVLLYRDVPLPNIVVRVESDELVQTVELIETQWTEFISDQPLQYSFLEDNFNELFEADRKLGRLFSSFSIFAVFIAGLGLFGLGLFVTEQRTKEIGVRKVLGATVLQVLVLLSKEFTKLVIIATVLALPAAYFGMNWWLEGFIYRTDMQVMSFVFAGVIALLIAWLTVSYQSIRAALSNPVDALRYE